MPLFLFWVYVTWLIVLFGLELTYTLQAMKGRRFKHAESQAEARSFTDPLWLVPVMATVGRAFVQGKVLTAGEIAFTLELPIHSVSELTEKLQSDGMLNPVQRASGDETAFALALPPDQIPLVRLLDLARSLSVAPHAQSPQAQTTGWAYLDQLARKQQQAAGATTLATLLAEPAAAAGQRR